MDEWIAIENRLFSTRHIHQISFYGDDEDISAVLIVDGSVDAPIADDEAHYTQWNIRLAYVGETARAIKQYVDSNPTATRVVYFPSSE